MVDPMISAPLFISLSFADECVVCFHQLRPTRQTYHSGGTDDLLLLL
jgi:hypothetical protein